MRWKTWAACAAIAALASITQAATIVDYNLTGLTTTAPTTTPATTVAAGVTADPLSRGPGINPAGLTNGFSSDNWTNVAADTGTIDKARAISMGDFYQWAITVDATHTVSLSGFDTNLRRSAVDAPMNFELQYSFDNFATAGTTAAQFMYLGRSSGTAPGTVTPFQWMTTDTPGQGNGNAIQQQNLSSVAGLQNIAPGSTVAFRLYAWGSGSANAANSNTVALGRTQGPLLSGTITEVVVPEPASLTLCLVGAIAAWSLRRR
ncbi:MAG: hypothetical protein U0805_04040 [Pirellulales bacterium]